MATIDLVSGAYDKNKSIPGTLWVIQADSNVLFEVKEWIPQIGWGDYGTGNAKAECAKKITWKLKDKTGKDLFGSKETTVTDKMQFAINKRYAGSYPYQLHAQLGTSNNIVNVGICGFCDADVTSTEWSLKSTEKDQSEINYGHVIYFTLETEGINGDSLTIEIYDKDDPLDIPLTTLEAECINGIIKAEVETLLLHVQEEAEDEKEETEYYIKLKNLEDKYILQGGEEKMSPFTIRHKVIKPEGKPENVTLTTINPNDGIKMTPTGVIELDKVKVATTNTVRNDEFSNEDRDAWILKDGGSEKYHWLRERKTEDDLGKPDPLPITITSTDKFIFTAYFKTIIEIDQAIIRVRDRKGKYTFKNKQLGSKSKDEQFEFEFESNNFPYENTIQYFPEFELIFEYSLDQEESWTPLDSVTFCLYLTWKEPYCDEYRKPGDIHIQETLLWLGCANAKGKGNTYKDPYDNQGEIIDEIFVRFTDLHIIRRRENEIRKNGKKKHYLRNNLEDKGLGYWRGNSDAINKFKGTTRLPTLKLLLEEHGEARCGEWAEFLRFIVDTQGKPEPTSFLSPIASFSFATEMRSDNIVFISIEKIKDENFETDDLQEYNEMALVKADNTTPQGLVYNLGTGRWEYLIKDTIKSGQKIKAVFLVNSPEGSWEIEEGEPPKQICAKAQGNEKPLHFFWDHVIAVYIHKTKKSFKYYDPSYGVSGSMYHTKLQDLLDEYAESNLKSVLAIDIPKTGGKRFKDTGHTNQWVPFTPRYTFSNSEEEVANFNYTYITKDMGKELVILSTLTI